MLKLFLILVVIYSITLLIVLNIFRKEDSKLTWKQAFKEMNDVPIVYVPILNTVIIIVYLIADLVEKFK